MRVPAPQGFPGTSPYPLFGAFPRLRAAIPRVPLGLWPTPVEAMPRLAEAIGSGPLWVKRDDLSALPYGGNKVRKLEVLLGTALAAGARDIITFGAAGSNHAFATAVYGRGLGFDVTLLLTPQPNATYVRRNLLGAVSVGATVRMHDDRDAAMSDAEALVAAVRERTGVSPFVIPFGGTTPESTVGAVNAGFEFAEQVSRGAAPAPGTVYVALGSMGTVAGISLGMALGGLVPLVRAVAVVPDTIGSERALRLLLAETVATLVAGDPSVPRDLASRVNIEVVDGFLGEGYARFTPAGMDAVRRAAEEEGLLLEGTYTGKTMAALIADAEAGALGSTTLFWDTFNSRDVSALWSDAEYRQLPEAAWPYFETDVQPLDAGGT